MSTITQSRSVSKAAVIKWAVSILIPAVILLLPTDEAFTSIVRNFMALTVFLIAMIATENLPVPAIALILPVSYIIFFKVPADVAFKAWSLEVPWLILCGFLLSNILVRTGLMKRIAYQCILAMGGKFVGILWGMLIIGTVFSLLVCDQVAKAVLLGTLALGMCKVLNLELGGKSASAIGLCCYLTVVNPGYLFYSASNDTLVVMGIINSMGLHIPSFLEYLTHMFVPQLIFTIICALAIQFFFKPDQEIESKDFLRSELKKMGPLTSEEIKVTVIAILLIIAVVTNSLHGIAIGWCFMIAIFIMLFPGLKLLTGEDFKSVNFPFVIFVPACLTIGIVSGYLGVGQVLADMIYPLIQGSVSKSILGVWSFGFLMNFILTPLAAYSAFTEPLAMMAQNLGINHLPFAYTFIQSLQQIILPYEWAPILFLYGFGMVSFKRMVSFSAVKSLLSLISIPLIFMTWWKIIGLL